MRRRVYSGIVVAIGYLRRRRRGGCSWGCDHVGYGAGAHMSRSGRRKGAVTGGMSVGDALNERTVSN